MKYRSLHLAACLLLSIGCANLFAAEKVLLTTQVWPPYQVYKGNNLEGTAVAIIKTILDKMGVSYEIRVYPWERAQFMVKTGAAQGFFLASKNAERDTYAIFSEVLFSQKWNWYLLQDSPLAPTDESFREKTCVLVRFGSNMRHWLTTNEYNIIGNFKNTEALIRALLSKRCEAMLANELVVNNKLQDMQISPDMFKTYLNRDKPLGVYWSKTFLSDNPEFIDEFNRLVKEHRINEGAFEPEE